MIPILYDTTETSFTSNGLGRLRDCIRCECVEERNSIYEVEFDYPVGGAHYDEIICGRIIGVKHDETNDIQPFDIYKVSKPINGVVTFNACHVSYRQRKLVVPSGGAINDIQDAFTMLASAVPGNPFTYQTDIVSTAYMSGAEGEPKTVRQLLGGVEGSILDAYGGEYEWDKFTVKLWQSRGQATNYTIRYGLNMMDYQDDTDYSDTYNAVIPYWIGQDANGVDTTVIGDMITSGSSMYDNRTACIPLNLTDKFESKPAKASLEAMALSYMSSNQTSLPAQTIKVDFIRLEDSEEYRTYAALQNCKLCDSVRVVFPRYKTEGWFKIVKTTFDVLLERYTEMELGTLSMSLSEALGIDSSSGTKAESLLIEEGTSGIWRYRKWADGTSECWGSVDTTTSFAVWTAPIYYGTTYVARQNFPTGLFIEAPNEFVTMYAGSFDSWVGVDNGGKTSATQSGRYYPLRVGAGSSGTYTTHFYEIGRWK